MRNDRSLLAVVAAALITVSSGAEEPCGGPAGPVRLLVDVTNVRSSEGLIAVTLYADDARRFLARRGALYVVRAAAQQGTTRMCVHLPEPGVYGLAVYHDEDGDRRFDRNGIGMPAEGFGFSNNPRVLLGIPSFRSVRLRVPRDRMRTSVKLRYR